MFGLGSQELLVILVIVLIMFGANRLPQRVKSQRCWITEAATHSIASPAARNG